jgi:hypothetical protein
MVYTGSRVARGAGDASSAKERHQLVSRHSVTSLLVTASTAPSRRVIRKAALALLERVLEAWLVVRPGGG